MNKLFVAALKEETVGLNYFYHIGVGKINATYNLTKLIHKHKPSEIINYGTAGAVKKGLSGIIECTSAGNLFFFLSIINGFFKI